MVIAKILIILSSGAGFWLYDDAPSLDRETCTMRHEILMERASELEELAYIESVACDRISVHQKTDAHFPRPKYTGETS